MAAHRSNWGLWLAGALLILLLPAVAFADIVYLKSGGTIEGKVIDNGASYRVITRDGELTIAKSQVLKIVPSEDPITVFDGKFKAIDAGAETATGAYLELAGWCREARLPTQERQCYEGVIALDPDNLPARTALGYEKIDGKWLVGDEKMTAKGMVKVKNQWVTPEAKQDIVRTDEMVKAAEEQKKTAEETKAAIGDLETTRLSLEALIQQAQLAAATAKTAEMAAVQAQQQLQAVRVEAEIARAQALQALLANQEVLRQIQAERAKLEALKHGGGNKGPATPADGPIPPAPKPGQPAGDATRGVQLP